jgi:hypothetical protein|tara:strand:+ start:219 stop:386 length:168 start_codon:yes stop_codon:yes gene_type:complete
VNNLLKIIIVCAAGIGVLYWAVANPVSASVVKGKLDSVVSACSETIDKLADSLTD